MAEHLREIPPVVLWFLGGFGTLIMALLTTLFVNHRRHHEKLDARTEKLEENLSALAQQAVGCEEDREGLHREIRSGFKALDDKLNLAVNLLKANGHSKGEEHA